MPEGTTGGGDLELLLADQATWLPLMLASNYDNKGNLLPKRIEDVLAASDVGTPFHEQLFPIIQEGWPRGVGMDYDWAPGVDTRDPEYACPAGKAVDVQMPAVGALPHGAGAIVAIEEYGGDIFFAQIGNGVVNTARVVRIDYPAGTISTSLALGVDEYMRGLLAADDGAGNNRLYAFSSNGGVQSGRVHEWNGSAWISTNGPNEALADTFGTNGRSRAKKVTWRGRDGVRNNAIVAISGPKTIAYTLPNADPKLAASWVEGVKIGTAYELIDLAASRGHVFVAADDNVFDLDEVGNTPGIASYIEEQVQPGNGDAVMYLDGRLYYAMGRGLMMINVEQDGTLQEVPGLCSPGAFLPVADCPRGYTTALCPDQSWVVNAVFDTTTRRSAIFWGKPREALGYESPNPMIWHGPLLFFETDYKVTRMRTSALAGDLKLWVGSIGDVSGTPRLSWMSLPLAGTTIQDQNALGAHRVTSGAAGGTLQPYSRMYSLRNTADDKASRKDIHADVIGSRGLDAATGTKIRVYNRADEAPGSDNWDAGADATISPVQTLTATTLIQGYALEWRVDFFAPQGGATLPADLKIPYLDSLRKTVWKTAPDFTVRTVEVEYGDGVVDLSNAEDGTRSPNWITDQLIALTRYGRTTMRDRHGARWTVRLRQVLPRPTEYGEGAYGQTVRAGLQIILLAAL